MRALQFLLSDRCCQLLVFAPRYCYDAITNCRQPSRNAEAYSPASACNDNITH